MKMKMKLPSMPKSDKLSVLLIMTVIIVALGVQYFIEVSKDEDVAHQLMQRELRIVEQQLFSSNSTTPGTQPTC